MYLTCGCEFNFVEAREGSGGLDDFARFFVEVFFRVEEARSFVLFLLVLGDVSAFQLVYLNRLLMLWNAFLQWVCIHDSLHFSKISCNFLFFILLISFLVFTLLSLKFSFPLLLSFKFHERFCFFESFQDARVNLFFEVINSEFLCFELSVELQLLDWLRYQVWVGFAWDTDCAEDPGWMEVLVKGRFYA